MPSTHSDRDDRYSDEDFAFYKARVKLNTLGYQISCLGTLGYQISCLGSVTRLVTLAESRREIHLRVSGAYVGYSAIDENTYEASFDDGAWTQSEHGTGATEREAVDDLLEQLAESYCPGSFGRSTGPVRGINERENYQLQRNHSWSVRTLQGTHF